MRETADRANTVVQPPIAWALAVAAGLGLDWLHPLPFVPGGAAHVWVGGAIFGLGVALALWAAMAMRRAGTRVEVHTPTAAIVTDGPYRFSRNPIYLGLFLGQIGIAVGFDSLWLLVMLLPLALVVRYGVIAREEVYLEGKFGDVYRRYRSHVRRWL